MSDTLKTHCVKWTKEERKKGWRLRDSAALVPPTLRAECVHGST